MAPSKDALARLRAIVVEDLPPNDPGPLASEVAGCAREQGLAGLLHCVLESREGAAWPPAVRSALAADRRAALVRGVRQLALAARVLRRLDRAGLRALPLKGAAVLETLYDSEADRTMADVDLLVLDGFPEAVSLLAGEGFAREGTADHAIVLRETHTGAVLELHHGVTSAPGLFPLDRDGLWARSVPGLGQIPRLPSPEDLLVHLSLHAAFQHGLSLSLSQWLDFRRLLERRAPDPDRLREVAARARAEAPLAAALAAAAAVVDAPVAPALVSGAVRGLAGRGWSDLVSPNGPDLLAVRMALLPGRRFALLRHTLVPDGPGGPVPVLHRLRRGAVRAATLTWRWGPRALGSALAGAVRARPGSGQVAGTPTGVPRPDGILRDVLGAFPSAFLTVTGDCMLPALAHGERVRLASPARRSPRFGDVVLVRQPEGLRLHRLVWGPPLPGRSWRTQADRGPLWDAAVGPGDVLGTVVDVVRPSGPRRVGSGFTSLRSLFRGLRSWLLLPAEPA